MENYTKQRLIEIKDLFLDTLSKCGTFLLVETDEKIEHYIFEEFDIGVISFFYKNTLEILFRNGLISKIVLDKSILLKQLVEELQNNNEWNIESFRSSPKWKVLLELSDNIKELDLKQSMGLETINFLFSSSEQMEYAIKMNKDVIHAEDKEYIYKKDNDYWIDLKFNNEYSLSIRIALCNPTEPTMIALDHLATFLFGFKDGIFIDIKAKKKYLSYNEEMKKDLFESFIKSKDVFKEMYGDFTAAISSEEFYRRQGLY